MSNATHWFLLFLVGAALGILDCLLELKFKTKKINKTDDENGDHHTIDYY